MLWEWRQPLGQDEMYHCNGYVIYSLYTVHTVPVVNDCEWMAASSENGLLHTLCKSKEDAMQVCEAHLLTVRLLGEKRK